MEGFTPAEHGSVGCTCGIRRLLGGSGYTAVVGAAHQRRPNCTTSPREVNGRMPLCDSRIARPSQTAASGRGRRAESRRTSPESANRRRCRIIRSGAGHSRSRSGGSSNGRTRDFGSRYPGSNPGPPASHVPHHVSDIATRDTGSPGTRRRITVAIGLSGPLSLVRAVGSTTSFSLWGMGATQIRLCRRIGRICHTKWLGGGLQRPTPGRG